MTLHLVFVIVYSFFLTIYIFPCGKQQAHKHTETHSFPSHLSSLKEKWCLSSCFLLPWCSTHTLSFRRQTFITIPCDLPLSRTLPHTAWRQERGNSHVCGLEPGQPNTSTWSMYIQVRKQIIHQGSQVVDEENVSPSTVFSLDFVSMLHGQS